MPTTPAIALDECLAALRAAEPARMESAFRIARAPSSPLLVSSEDVPYLLLSRADLAWFNLSDDATRLVLRVDGETSVDSLTRALALDFDKVCGLLSNLADQEIHRVRRTRLRPSGRPALAQPQCRVRVITGGRSWTSG